MVPIFIVCRDKVSPLRELVTWLETHGYERLILVDNASTYPPLTEFLRTSPHEVVLLRDNLGPFDAIWATGVRDKYAKGEQFVVTDCDVIPDDNCPADAVDYFDWCLRRYPTYVKAGFSLRIDNLPSNYTLASEVREWEQRFWSKRIRRFLFDAMIDTTFALYRPNSEFCRSPAIRTGSPYLARHAPWYTDTANPSEEDIFYRAHCRTDIAHWDLTGHRGGNNWRMSMPKRLRWRAFVALKLPRDRTVERWINR